MTLFLLIAAALGLVTVALLTRSLWWSGRAVVTPADDASAVTEATPVRAAPSTAMTLTLGVFVFAVAGLGYYRLGAPSKLALGPESSQAAAPVDTPEFTPEQMATIISRLKERVTAKPEDSEGWLLLGRSYMATEQYAEASEAYRKLAKLRPDDANVMLNLADAIAMANNRNLLGEPAQLIEQAVKLDPNNAKALALAGTAAYLDKNYKAAIAHWEKLLQLEPEGSELAQRVQATIAKAREMDGGGAAPAMAAASAAPQAKASEAVAGGQAAVAVPAQVSGVVSLAPALLAKASPDDTVFVFARPAQGARMPLAILRKQVKDLPFSFTLDDSMAMSPAAKLSDNRQVTVGARISKSGTALPQPGDLQGLVSAAVGSTGLKIEISEVVSP